MAAEEAGITQRRARQEDGHPILLRAIEVGTDFAGLALDLMRLDYEVTGAGVAGAMRSNCDLELAGAVDAPMDMSTGS